MFVQARAHKRNYGEKRRRGDGGQGRAGLKGATGLGRAKGAGLLKGLRVRKRSCSSASGMRWLCERRRTRKSNGSADPMRHCTACAAEPKRGCCCVLPTAASSLAPNAEKQYLGGYARASVARPAVLLLSLSCTPNLTSESTDPMLVLSHQPVLYMLPLVVA